MFYQKEILKFAEKFAVCEIKLMRNSIQKVLYYCTTLNKKVAELI